MEKRVCTLFQDSHPPSTRIFLDWQRHIISVLIAIDLN